MTDDVGENLAIKHGGEAKILPENQDVFSGYESLYNQLIETERMALQKATKDFFSKKELKKAQNAGVSFILTKGMDELVRFMEHKLKTGDVASLIFVYQRLKFYCLDSLKLLYEKLAKLQNFLSQDDYYRDKKIVSYWKLRSKRLQSYGRGTRRIVDNLKLVFDQMNIPDSLLEVETDNEDGQAQEQLASHLKNVTVEVPGTLAALFKLE